MEADRKVTSLSCYILAATGIDGKLFHSFSDVDMAKCPPNVKIQGNLWTKRCALKKHYKCSLVLIRAIFDCG